MHTHHATTYTLRTYTNTHTHIHTHTHTHTVHIHTHTHTLCTYTHTHTHCAHTCRNTYLQGFLHIEQHEISRQLVPWLSSTTSFLPFLLPHRLGSAHVDALLAVAVHPVEVMVGVRSTSLKTLATETEELADFAAEMTALYRVKTTTTAPEIKTQHFPPYRRQNRTTQLHMPPPPPPPPPPPHTHTHTHTHAPQYFTRC